MHRSSISIFDFEQVNVVRERFFDLFDLFIHIAEINAWSKLLLMYILKRNRKELR